MINPTQRWRLRRDSYRPAGEPLATREYDVACCSEGDAKGFVLDHHYSGSYPAARFRFGLYHHGALVGAAVFSHPTRNEVLTSVFPIAPALSVELGRFVLLDRVPANGETFFLARCFEQLRREGLAGCVSFSDPIPRTAESGLVVFPGHIGTIYQAHNAAYLGRATARTLRILPDGTVLSPRALQKLRAGERGEAYVGKLLERHGARPRGAEEPRAWLRSVLGEITRTMRHPGNHRYAWALDRSAERFLDGRRLPYPKWPNVRPMLARPPLLTAPAVLSGPALLAPDPRGQR